MEKGAAWSTKRPIAASATPSTNVSQPFDKAPVEMRTSDQSISKAQIGGNILTTPSRRLSRNDLMRSPASARNALPKSMNGATIARSTILNFDSCVVEASVSGRSRIAATMFSLLARYEEKKTVINVSTTPRQYEMTKLCQR